MQKMLALILIGSLQVGTVMASENCKTRELPSYASMKIAKEFQVERKANLVASLSFTCTSRATVACTEGYFTLETQSEVVQSACLDEADLSAAIASLKTLGSNFNLALDRMGSRQMLRRLNRFVYSNATNSSVDFYGEKPAYRLSTLFQSLR